MSANVLVIDDHALIRITTEHLINQHSDMICVEAVEELDTDRDIPNRDSVGIAVGDLQFATGNALGFIAEQTN